MGNIGPNINGQPFQQFGQQAQTANTGGSFQTSQAGGSSAAANQLVNQFAAAVVNQLLGDMLLAPFFSQQLGMSAKDYQMFLKNLFQFPQEFQQLLTLLMTGDNKEMTKQLLALLKANPKLSMEEVQQFLLKQMDGAQGKLMKLLQSSNMAKTGDSQAMGELLNRFTSLNQQITRSPTEALNTMMMMYLPFHPGVQNQQFSMHFEMPEKDDENESESAEPHLILQIATGYLGRFKVVVALLTSYQVMVQLDYEAEGKPVIPVIQEALAQSAIDMNATPPEVQLHQRDAVAYRPPALPEQSNTMQEVEADSIEVDPVEVPTSKRMSAKDNQHVMVSSVGAVPVLLVHFGYLVARVILEEDGKRLI